MPHDPFFRNNNVDAVRRLVDENVSIPIREGTVASVPLTGPISVRLNGSANAIQAEMLAGVSVQVGNRVVLYRSQADRWIVLGAYRLTADGSQAASPGSSRLLAPPESISGVNGIGTVTFVWAGVGPRGDVVYELELSTSASASGDTYLLAGSVYEVAVPEGETRYARVRSMDINWNRSGWSAWASATALALPPADGTYLLQQADPDLPNAQAMGDLATGLVKNTTSTGVQSIAAKADLDNTFGSQTANRVYAAPNGAAGNPDFRALVADDYPTMVGDSGSGGTNGAVPAPAAGDATKYLKGNGTWDAPSGGGSLPAGMMAPYGGSSAPNGWLLCDGSAVSRTTYAALYTAIGTTFGAGDGSTTFNVPDLRGRIPLGKDDMGGTAANRVTATQADNVGQSSGEETHTLTTTEMPAHSHAVVGVYGAALVSDLIDICDDRRIVLSKAQDAVARYWDCDVAADVNALAENTTILPGTPIDKATLLGAITLLQQFQAFMNNQAVTTNTYRVTINKVAALKA